MKFSVNKIESKGQGKYVVVVDGDEWQEAIKKAKNKVMANVQIPGFRKGKVPPQKAQKFVTSAKYLPIAVQSIVDKAWKFALDQKAEIKPFNSPVPNPSKVDESSCEIEFVFDLMPEFNISDYKNIKDKSLVKEKVEVSQKEIDEAIDQYRERFVMEKEKEKECKIEKGDLVKFDFEGFVDEKPFKGGKGIDFQLVIGSNKMIPGFEDSMIGKGLGECSINVVFPKDYTKELSEKAAEFKLNIKEIKERILPDKDDELVKDLNIPKIKTYQELENNLKERILKEKENKHKNLFVNNLIEIIRKNSKIDLPQSAINKETNKLFKEFEAKLKSQNVSLKDYKEQTKLSDQDIKDELFIDAKKRLESYLITDKVRNEEKFEVSDQEINDKYESLAKNFGVEVEFIKKSLFQVDYIKEEIIREKIVNFLYENNG